ncbi:LAMI_0G14422g1_1 [Lachancea mirantina]|uniref:LAMI_0G14422g1_1 n=1 Tax=Lachancea mirantina TaxID=1230905 RepID=A0A1G4KC34_9SACH|nr:LAMI_0G14422g1_1 [Lachancea mirantina]
MGDKKSTEAEDVLQFLDSLPEGKETGNKEVKKGRQEDSEILDFLDELEQSNLSLNKPKGTTKTPDETPDAGLGAEDKKHGANASETGADNEGLKSAGSETRAPAPEKVEQHDYEEESQQPLNDPITSISNWWSSSGSATVNSFFSKTAEQANQLKDRLAHEQQGIASRLQTTSLGSKISATTISTLAKNLTRIVVGETDEVLRIHLVHDLVGYPMLPYHVEQQFDRVLSSQVQSGVRIFVDEWDHPIEGERRKDDGKRHLNLFTGKFTDGEKLAFANINNAVKLFNAAKEELEKQRVDVSGHERQQTNEEQNISDLFISVLPVAIPVKSQDAGITTTDAAQPGNFSFVVVLKDVTNDTTSITRSQGFPQKWADWLEGTSALKARDEHDAEKPQATAKESDDDNTQPEDIDPSEWVKEWVEDGLSLTFGVVAQNYIIERMGFE